MRSFEDQLDVLIRSALDEDIGEGDHSTLACIPPEARGKAVLKIKQEGTLAGVAVAEAILRQQEPGTTFTSFMHDGETMIPGQEAFEAEASVRTLLQCERLLLNCMQRMSGIATLTKIYVDKLAGYKTRILDTRKTTPNFRLLEKEAVRIGGAVNHRFGLSDMIMLKDNHIDFCGGIEKALDKAWNYIVSKNLSLKIEVETRNIEDVRLVVASGKADRIMLDNFTPSGIRAAVELIGGRFETEASGGIHLDNLLAYADTGVDFISIGALIHQAKSVDLSFKAKT